MYVMLQSPSLGQANVWVDLDAEPTPQARARVHALLASELPPEARTTLHPSIPEPYEPTFSPLIAAELERVAAKKPLAAIDTARYESLDAPEENGSIDRWKDTLRKAYTADSHLKQRQTNLANLERYGKNAWLLGNYQLEHELKAIEKELVETRDAVERLNQERKSAQDAIRGELENLESTWRTGVGRALEVEIANEGIRQQILEAQRKNATA
jgi:pre-mRNA-splicing factor SPF27